MAVNHRTLYRRGRGECATGARGLEIRISLVPSQCASGTIVANPRQGTASTQSLLYYIIYISVSFDLSYYIHLRLCPADRKAVSRVVSEGDIYVILIQATQHPPTQSHHVSRSPDSLSNKPKRLSIDRLTAFFPASSNKLLNLSPPKKKYTLLRQRCIDLDGSTTRAQRKDPRAIQPARGRCASTASGERSGKYTGSIYTTCGMGGSVGGTGGIDA